ncbi:MAG TPA: hypothetical protein VK066_12295 [Chloroflexota bacterium]|nr:hypothetical protein [Chloroflexota bacterium]
MQCSTCAAQRTCPLLSEARRRPLLALGQAALVPVEGLPLPCPCGGDLWRPMDPQAPVPAESKPRPAFKLL